MHPQEFVLLVQKMGSIKMDMSVRIAMKLVDCVRAHKQMNALRAIVGPICTQTRVYPDAQMGMIQTKLPGIVMVNTLSF